MVNVAKRSEHVRNMSFLIEANRLISSYFISEAKRSKLIESCDSSEAKRTRSNFGDGFSKRSEHVYIRKIKNRNVVN
jgi:hypothetical protein